MNDVKYTRYNGGKHDRFSCREDESASSGVPSSGGVGVVFWHQRCHTTAGSRRYGADVKELQWWLPTSRQMDRDGYSPWLSPMAGGVVKWASSRTSFQRRCSIWSRLGMVTDARSVGLIRQRMVGGFRRRNQCGVGYIRSSADLTRNPMGNA